MSAPLTYSPTIARYIAKTFAMRIVLVLLGLIAIIQTMDVIGESNRILAATNTGEANLWAYVVLRLPILVSQFTPFAVLLASLITLGTLAVTSQVVVMRSLGLSAHHILAPMVMVGAVCAVFQLAWTETVTVKAARQLAVWQASGYGANLQAIEGAHPTWVMAGDSAIRANVTLLADGSISLKDVAIFKRPKAAPLIAATFAERGTLSVGGRGVLENVRSVGLGPQTAEEARHLEWVPGLTSSDFFRPEVNPEHNSFFSVLAAVRAVPGGAQYLSAELYHKLMRPMASLFMPLLAAIAAFGLSRTGNVLMRAGIGLGLGFAYFVADNFVMAMGHAGSVPPVMAACFATLLFIILGETLLFRTEQ